MSSKTKIVVLRMKEIIYTAVFIGFGIFLILLLVIMFRPKKDTPASAKGTVYHPGVYSSALHLGSQEVNVEVTVDAVEITGVSRPIKRFCVRNVSSRRPICQELERTDLRNPVSQKSDLPTGIEIHFPGTDPRG